MNISRNSILTLAIAALLAAPLSAQRGRPDSQGPRGGAGGPGGGPERSAIERADPMPGSRTLMPGGSGSVLRGGVDGRRRAAVMPIRPNHAPPVQRFEYFHRSRVIVPPVWWPRCSVTPDPAFWGRRDLFAEIQWLQRAGFIPITPVDPSTEVIEDYAFWPAGWKAYGFALPPGGRLQVEVQHEKLGWFRLMAVDKWGQPGPGMLQAAVAHRPVMITVSNPGKENSAVYVIVDDPGWWSSKEDPFKLVVRRDWDPGQTDLSSVKMATGIWGASPSVSAQFRRSSLTGPAVFPH